MPYEHEGGDWDDASISQETLKIARKPLQAGGGLEQTRLHAGTDAASALPSDFWPSELGEKTSVLQATRFVALCYSSLSKK